MPLQRVRRGHERSGVQDGDPASLLTDVCPGIHGAAEWQRRGREAEKGEGRGGTRRAQSKEVQYVARAAEADRRHQSLITF